MAFVVDPDETTGNISYTWKLNKCAGKKVISPIEENEQTENEEKDGVDSNGSESKKRLVNEDWKVLSLLKID